MSMVEVELQLKAQAAARVRGRAVPSMTVDALMLAWLALQGATLRARLAELLWPDSGASAARATVLALAEGVLHGLKAPARGELADPELEAAHRAVVRGHCLLGDRAAVLAVCTRSEQMLRRTLDVAPSAKTQALRRLLDVETGAAASGVWRLPQRPTPQALGAAAGALPAAL
ncbi:MAG: Bacterial transcriptional activator domain, partial [Pseudomonadota bacterium]